MGITSKIFPWPCVTASLASENPPHPPITNSRHQVVVTMVIGVELILESQILMANTILVLSPEWGDGSHNNTAKMDKVNSTSLIMRAKDYCSEEDFSFYGKVLT